MQNMFKECKSLTKLNISNFNLANIEVDYMFKDCKSLKEITLSRSNNVDIAKALLGCSGELKIKYF